MTRTRRQPRRRDGQAGFTLVELMIATVLLSLVIAMTLQLAFTMVEGYRSQRAALAVERNARGAIDLIANAARAASTGVVTGDLRDAAGCTAAVGIAIENHDDGPDRLTVIYGITGALTSTRAMVNGTTTSFPVTDASGLSAGDLVIVTNGDVGRVYPVTTLAGDQIYSTLGGCAGLVMPDLAAGSLVVRARVAVFYVEDSADGTPMLMLDPDGDGARLAQPVAEGIEDFQVALGVDADDNGMLDDFGDTTDEWFYNAEGDTDPPAIASGLWRALRITIVARDLKPTGDQAMSTRPAAEDHDIGVPDPYRRRVLTTTAEIRNFVEGTP
jgi:prepilin-type N-terminal cleavage/methylation domain-containing protein